MAKRFRGIITGADFETSDHRILEGVTWRALPLTLRVQTEDFGGHDGASPVGAMMTIEAKSVADCRAMGFEIPPEADGAQPYFTDGMFSETAPGQLAATWVEEQVLRGVSVDPGAIEYVEELIDPATGETVSMEQVYEAWDQIDAASILGDDAEEARIMEWLESLYYRVRFTTYEIAAATLVATPAIGWATIEVYDDGTGTEGQPQDGQGADSGQASQQNPTVAERLAALAVSPVGRESVAKRLSGLVRTVEGEQVAAFGPGRMIASAGAAKFRPGPDTRQAGAGPTVMHAAWFQPQKLAGPTKFTIDSQGRMSGHLFTWNSCHRASTARCETPEFRNDDYRNFHVGETALDDGSRLRTGVLTYADLHAEGGRLTVRQLQRLMEDTGAQLGPVRLHADEHGLQACGEVFDDVPATQVARVLAGFPSYDARRISGVWRLFGLHVVNTPGHPMYEEAEDGSTRMVASVAPNMAAHDCGCGGTCDTCSHDGHAAHHDAQTARSSGLSAAALADLAALDDAHARRSRIPTG